MIGAGASLIARVLVLPIQATLSYPVQTHVYCQSEGVNFAMNLVMRTRNHIVDIMLTVAANHTTAVETRSQWDPGNFTWILCMAPFDVIKTVEVIPKQLIKISPVRGYDKERVQATRIPSTTLFKVRHALTSIAFVKVNLLCAHSRTAFH